MRQILLISIKILILTFLVIIQTTFLNQLTIFFYHFDLLLLIVLYLSLNRSRANNYWLIIFLGFLTDCFAFYWGLNLISFILIFFVLQLLIKKVFTSETFYRNSVLIIIATISFYLINLISKLIIYFLFLEQKTSILTAWLNTQLLKQFLVQLVINLLIVNTFIFFQSKFNQWYLISNEKKKYL